MSNLDNLFDDILAGKNVSNDVIASKEYQTNLNNRIKVSNKVNKEISKQNKTTKEPSNWKEQIETFRKVFRFRYENDYSKRLNELETKINELTHKKEVIQSKLPGSLAKKATFEIDQELQLLQLKYNKLIEKLHELFGDLDYYKGRDAGFITPENAEEYWSNPDLAAKELATGKYEYLPSAVEFLKSK